jgi:tetratricopeptide (TPR) repeat protein
MLVVSRVLIAGLALFCGKIMGLPWPAQDTAARPVYAKSQQEAADYHADYLILGGTAVEQAAISFAQKYPSSELRSYLFAKAMLEYQRENNSVGIMKMGERVLALDPNHVIALILTATVLADGLGPGDPDRDKKIAMVKKKVASALQTVDTSFIPPATVTVEEAAIYKTTLHAMAYSALGVVNLKTGDYADAEKNLELAADLAKIHPDPYIWYHLALAQDHRRKYPAALHSVEQALQLASANPDLQKIAETEHQRLTRLTRRTGESPDSGDDPPPQ